MKANATNLLGRTMIAVALTFFFSTANANIFTVTTTNSSGPGSLQQVLWTANETLGKDTIRFNIAGVGPFILKPDMGQGYFPRITEALFIDGYSQTGSAQGAIGSRQIMIVLDGTGLPFLVDGLNIKSSDVEITGICIRNFDTGFRIENSLQNVFIWGCYVGTDTTGTVAVGNSRNGIWANWNGSDSLVNITIGTNGDGSNDANEGNLIGACADNGILLYRTHSSRIAGNYIGVTSSGTGNLNNTNNGILLDFRCLFNTIGTNGDGISDALERNIIGNNGASGIWMRNSSNNNVIAGNILGLDVLYNKVPNYRGILIQNAGNIRVGTNADGNSDLLEANIIAGNNYHGIYVKTGQSYNGNDIDIDNVFIAGNLIGTYPGDVAGTKGNISHGVYFEVFDGKSISNCIVGSNNDGLNDNLEGNIIANNLEDGISTYTAFGAGGVILNNTFSRNSIYNNAGLGIELKLDAFGFGTGVTPNDNGDGDTGPNNYLNAPVITNVTDGGSSWIITGFCAPDAIIEFFNADAGPTPNPLPIGFTKSFGEGATFYIRVKDNATLNGYTDNDNTTGTYTSAEEGNNNPSSVTENRFEFTIDKSVFPGLTRLVATATDINGNTSEFGGTFTNAALPVQLLNFSAAANDNKVTVQWKTARELNAERFDVLRSADGRNFTKIGSVPAGSRDGQYQLIDYLPFNKTYYRLEQFDKDGKSTLSKIVFVQMGAFTRKLTVSPNPFTENINIGFTIQEAGNVFIKMIDQLGRPVRTYQYKAFKGNNNYLISDVNNLPSGLYFIEISGKDLKAQQQILKAN